MTTTYRCKSSVPELKQILKDNNVKGQSLNKPEIIKVLIYKGVLKHQDIYTEVIKVKERKKNVKLPFIRLSPRRVTITYVDTGEVLK
jgi:hypothetical protein